MKHSPSILIILISAMLMQWHSIAFWLEYAGYTGVGFSLALEVVALWLWWQRRTWLAIAASLLLVGGPLFHLSTPVMETLTRTDVNQALITSYEKEIAQLNSSLSRYDQNSAKRLGWSARIDQAQSKLTAARNELRGLLKVKTPETPLRLYLIVIMQALALIIIMRAQIIAITSLPLISTQEPKQVNKKQVQTVRKRVKVPGADARMWVAAEKEEAEKTNAPSNKSSGFDDRVAAVVPKMRKQIALYDGKQRAFAEAIDIRPADVSMALNHTERKAAGKETLSEPKLLKIEQAMEAV